MSIFWLIVILFLIWIASPIFKVWRKVRQFQDEYNRTTSGSRPTGSDNNYQQGKQRSDEQQEMVERYRRYSDATAENVDFEELEGKMDDSTNEQPSDEHTTHYQDEIISDAEFEEIG